MRDSLQIKVLLAKRHEANAKCTTIHALSMLARKTGFKIVHGSVRCVPSCMGSATIEANYSHRKSVPLFAPPWLQTCTEISLCPWADGNIAVLLDDGVCKCQRKRSRPTNNLAILIILRPMAGAAELV